MESPDSITSSLARSARSRGSSSSRSLPLARSAFSATMISFSSFEISLSTVITSRRRPCAARFVAKSLLSASVFRALRSRRSRSRSAEIESRMKRFLPLNFTSLSTSFSICAVSTSRRWSISLRMLSISFGPSADCTCLSFFGLSLRSSSTCVRISFFSRLTSGADVTAARAEPNAAFAASGLPSSAAEPAAAAAKKAERESWGAVAPLRTTEGGRTRTHEPTARAARIIAADDRGDLMIVPTKQMRRSRVSWLRCEASPLL